LADADGVSQNDARSNLAQRRRGAEKLNGFLCGPAPLRELNPWIRDPSSFDARWPMLMA
jgi:hypothetical protein